MVSLRNLAPLGGNITIQRETKVSLRNLLSFAIWRCLSF